MTILRRILIGFLSGMLACMPVFANNCDNPTYRKYNPEKCRDEKSFSFGTTASVIGGGAAIIGGALALFANTNVSAQTTPEPQPTLQTYNNVGADIDQIKLASILDTEDYSYNFNQYNDIRLAYSLARGYTGKNSTIAVLDGGDDTFHGKKVATLASGAIAPDAIVKTYKIVDQDMNFLPYKEIGDTIKSANGANIYNFSWSVPMRANAVVSYKQMTRVTDANFLEQISSAATHDDAIFVVAAGNDYDKHQSNAISALPVVMPELKGHYVNVVAWDSSTGALAEYSNACGVTKDWCITAPGSAISTGESTLAVSGTSFATPIVSAAIAVIREAFPYMSSPEITNLLFATARDLGDAGTDEIYGHGMLDLERATRPVGVELVSISENMNMRLSTAKISGPAAHTIKSADIKFAFIDSFGRAFDADLNDNISVKNRSQALNRLREYKMHKTSLGNFEFGFKQHDLLTGDGFMKTDSENMLGFIGWRDNYNIGNTDVFFGTNVGFAVPQTTPESMITGFSNINTVSGEIGIRHNDWTFKVAIPDTIIAGNMNLHIPVGRDIDGKYLFQDHKLNLVDRPAVELIAQYKFISAGFVDNPYGTDEFYIIGHGKFMF